ncbi:Conserved protein of unknown function (part1) [Mycobacterium canettii CIPT 140060008]|nr:Conserved protein of unknown function (part1) [Mycobacterium canettii CIPT 140060008]
MVRETRVRVARVYEDIDPDDGQRVLVDRIWPHGIRKDDQRVGIWCKTSHHPKSCASGTTTSRSGLTNSRRATRRSCTTARH